MEESKKKENPNLFSMNLTVGKDGAVGFSINVEEGERHPGDVELIGLLEMVKHDLLSGFGQNQKEENVEVTLVEDDFKMPQAKQLHDMGKAVGDTVSMPKSIAMAREAVLARMSLGSETPVVEMKSSADVEGKGTEIE